MSSPLDAVFGKLAKMPYRLSIHFVGGLLLADGELTVQREQRLVKGRLAFGRIEKYYADDTEVMMWRSDAVKDNLYKEVELVLKRTMPRYYIELWLAKKLWYYWSADTNPYDDLFYGGALASLNGPVGNWGSAHLSLTLK